MENVDQFVFGDSCDELFGDLKTNPVQSGNDDDRIIMWDNLGVHNTAYVIHIMIEERASPNIFTTMNKPAYMPKIAPIEYVFCELT
eukprot:scaffold7483_cov121-Chaetoceros_neogracile.AAC.1